jgi:hypothetical protein
MKDYRPESPNVKVLKLSKPTEEKPKNQHTSVPLVEDKETEDRILANGRKIAEQSSESQEDVKKD